MEPCWILMVTCISPFVISYFPPSSIIGWCLLEHVLGCYITSTRLQLYYAVINIAISIEVNKQIIMKMIFKFHFLRLYASPSFFNFLVIILPSIFIFWWYNYRNLFITPQVVVSQTQLLQPHSQNSIITVPKHGPWNLCWSLILFGSSGFVVCADCLAS